MRKIKILLIALILILGGVFFSNTYAATRNLKVQLTRPYETNPGQQYKYLVDPDNSKYTVVKIYEDGDNEYNKIFYCLRGGVGFGAHGEDISTESVLYTEIGEMHKNANQIIEKMNTYMKHGKSIDREESFDNIQDEGTNKSYTANIYNSILWILDNVYLPKDIKNRQGELVYDASEYKEKLLDEAGVPNSEKNEITDNDIEVIQQLAIWYFANYDEQQGGDEPTVSQKLTIPVAVVNHLRINDQNINGQKVNNLNNLYKYFVYNAIKNSNTYTVNGETKERTKTVEKNEFDKTTPLSMSTIDGERLPSGQTLSGYYKIGPIKIAKNNINSRNDDIVLATDVTLCDAQGNVIPSIYNIPEESALLQSTHTIYEFINESGSTVKELQKGINYYIKFSRAFEKEAKDIPYIKENEQYDMSKVKVKINSSYDITKATFLCGEITSQPVVEIEREKVSSSDEITTDEKKTYDLALRKFITSVNENELTGDDSRVPKIDVSKLNTTDRNQKITTATYEHPKTPVPVETNNKVVYTIRVYNEGETDGEATKIVDYLPDGLELVDSTESEINRTYKWTKLDGNEKVITTDYLTGKTIKAYNPNKTSKTGDENWQQEENGTKGLYYEDVKVECKVIAQVGSSDKSLRNIAEIFEDDGEDRDSTPHNKQDPYTTWQQDDDDYEDLVLKAKEFDLALRKFISKVERPNKDSEGKTDLNITPRVPQIEIKDLKNGTSKTARYVHTKNQLSLKKGDIITYTIRVYNEGQIDGYAKKVTDYLPNGLELVPGQEEIWTEGENNSITTTVLENEKIKHYDKKITTAPEGENWQQATDDLTGLYYRDLTVVCKIKDTVPEGTVLKNVAEITIDGSDPESFDDRDSDPDSVYDDEKHEPKPEENGYTPGEEDDDDFESVVVEPDKVFDLALRKYIVAKNGHNLEGNDLRIPNIDVTPLKSGEKTAKYNHKKYPVEVEVGDIVTYRFTMYNEGDLDGYVYSIVDYLPAGLEFDKSSNDKFIEYKESYTSEELQGKEYAYKIEENKLTITPVNGDKKIEIKAFNGNEIDATNSIDVKFKITASESNDDQVLTNVATMTYEAKDSDQSDRDSSGDIFTVPSKDELLADLPGYKGKSSNKDDLTDSEYFYENEEDDGDFEKVVIKGKPFDLALRKYISSIKRNGKNVDIDDRTPKIHTETLINGTFDRNGKNEYTATYEHSKEPLVVKKGDIITYTLRVYNEGARDGYASQITDYIPEGLALILNYNTNYNNGWKLPTDVDNSKIIKLVGNDGFYKTEADVKNLKLEDFSETTSLDEVQLITGKVAITTSELDNQLIKAFDKNKIETSEGENWQKATTGDGGLYYKDVQVSCLVIAENTYKDTITNVAEISQDKDKNGNPGTDRDSIPNNKKDPYTTWQQDDDDYEQVVLRYFDLALRKFITSVESNGKVEDVTSRIPNPKIGEDGNIKYEHSKEPVSVANNDIVTYTLRVYNEGTLAGYAEEITDDIPEGLIYLPDNDINKQYEWKMIDKDGNVTDDIGEASKITTDYLSEAKESKDRNNLIAPFDSSKAISTEKPLNPDYRDVKVAFRVIEPNTSDRTIVNSAQISKDSDDDEDSTPDEWKDGEDDQDREYVHVKYFDLSLLKWVTKTVVTVDGKTTTTETGFKPNKGKTETNGVRENDKNEPVAKVEIDRKKIDKTTVKFVYKIRVTNEGEIAGYATEITDFIPEGLEFKAEDNKKYGWVKEGDNKVTTRALETVLLQPGKSAEVEIVFTWKKDKNNLGVKTNIAEITEDYNENNSKDIDSTPNNKKNPYDKEQEDDDDFALVILSLKTGKAISYTLLITVVVSTLAGGIYLIKRYVLRY